MQAKLKRQYWIRPKSFWAIFLVVHCLKAFSAQLPAVLTPLEASQSVIKLSAYVGFGYSGIALATHPVPHLIDGKTIHTSTAALWCFNGKELVKIDFPISLSKK
jgi:hypothetical protein